MPALALPEHLCLRQEGRIWLLLRLDAAALERLPDTGPGEFPETEASGRDVSGNISRCQALTILARHVCALGGGLPTAQHWQASFEIARQGVFHEVEHVAAAKEEMSVEMSRLLAEVRAGAHLHRAALIQALRSGIDPLVFLSAITDPRDCWGLRAHFPETGEFYGVDPDRRQETVAALLLGAGMPRSRIAGMTGLSADRVEKVLGDDSVTRMIGLISNRYAASQNALSAKDGVDSQAERLAGALFAAPPGTLGGARSSEDGQGDEGTG